MAIGAPARPPLTYAGLEAQFDLVARTLAGLGYGRDARVAVSLRQSPELAVCVLAASTATTVLPLNHTLIEAECRSLLSLMGAEAVIVEHGESPAARAAAAALGLHVIELRMSEAEPPGAFRLEGAAPDASQPAPMPAPSDTALVLATSGTTGRPKRVPLTHANLASAANQFVAWFKLRPSDCGLSVMPYFHLHGLVCNVLSPLFSGGAFICTSGFDDARFFQALRTSPVTWYSAVPSIHHAVMAAAADNTDAIADRPLRFIQSASAPIAPAALRELEAVFSTPVIEGYGLTETAALVFSNPMPPGARKPGSVGFSIGADVMVADPSGVELSPGVAGEVLMRGDAVTAGYEDDPEANGAGFHGRWLRTGDQGHFDEDGYLFLTGRFKELINRGGEMIAPLEIDHALSRHPDVAEAVAFSLPHRTLGEEAAVAVVLQPGAELDAAALRAFAGEVLSPHKVPRVIRFVDALPKTAAGKPQRVGLVEKLGLDQESGAGDPGALSDTEAAVLAIWRDVLGEGAPGVDDEFFLLGGDSLQAVRLIAEMSRRLHVDLSLDAIFEEASTPRAMAAAVERWRKSEGSGPEFAARPPDAPWLAAPTQAALWIASRLRPGEPVFNVTIAVRLSGLLDVMALEQALARLAERHALLRAGFVRKGRLLAVELGGSPPRLERATGEAAARFLQRRNLLPFDMTAKPLWRCALLAEAVDRHVLALTLHHAIVDGRSYGPLLADLGAYYGEAVGAGDARLPEAASFADFAYAEARFLASEAAERQTAAWRRRLAGAPEPTRLAPSRPRPAHLGWRARRLSMQLDRATTDRLLVYGRAQKSTLNMTLLAGFARWLSAETGEAEILVGGPTANRPGAGFDRTLGCFTTTLPYRIKQAGASDFATVLADVRRTLVDCHTTQALPMERIGEAAGTGAAPLFVIAFRQEDFFDAETAFPGLEAAPVDFDPGACSLYELSVAWREAPDGLVFDFDYAADLFDDDEVGRWLEAYRAVLSVAAQGP